MCGQLQAVNYDVDQRRSTISPEKLTMKQCKLMWSFARCCSRYWHNRLLDGDC